MPMIARRIAPAGVVFLLVFCGSFPTFAHTPVVDSNLRDWCVGATSNTANGGGRVEDHAVTLTCGNCSISTNRACEIASDCPVGETCINTTSKVETAFWDNRTDGAVNDLGTVVMTQNATTLFIGAELWVDPDPVSLPFGEIAIDFKAGGVGRGTTPTTSDGAGPLQRVHGPRLHLQRRLLLLQHSDEPTGGAPPPQGCVTAAQCPVESCIHRLRTCGSACDSGDTCNTSQTCVDRDWAGSRGTSASVPAPPAAPTSWSCSTSACGWWVRGTRCSSCGRGPRLIRPTPTTPGSRPRDAHPTSRETTPTATSRRP
jgi:hypothetical protein